MTLRLITPPVNLTVSLETAKTYARVDGTADDALLTSLIQAATETGEAISRRAFLTQTLELVLDAWPTEYRMTLWRPPLQSVMSVQYLPDDAVVWQTWTDYVVDANSAPGAIVFESIPGVALEESGAIRVRYVAGYGDTESSVPERIKLAILALVAYWYESRDLGGVPAAIRSMFLRDRVVWF